MWPRNGTLSLNGMGLWRERLQLRVEAQGWAHVSKAPTIAACVLPLLTACKDDQRGGWPSGLGWLHHDQIGLSDTLSDGCQMPAVVTACSVELGSILPATRTWAPALSVEFPWSWSYLSQWESHPESRNHQAQGDQRLLPAVLLCWCPLPVCQNHHG